MKGAAKRLQRTPAVERDSAPPSQSGEFPIVQAKGRRRLWERLGDRIKTSFNSVEGAMGNLAKPSASEMMDQVELEGLKTGPRVIAFRAEKKEDAA